MLKSSGVFLYLKVIEVCGLHPFRYTHYIVSPMFDLYWEYILHLFFLQIENRFSPQSKQTEIERRSGQRSDYVANGKTLQDFMRLNKDTMTGRSLCLMSPSSHQKQTVTEPVTDVLTEMFPDTAKTPTGIYATKRRPIKGAAGRPVQFKYPEMPLLSPTTLERQEIQQRLVPLWVQILVFLLVACLLYIIYLSMEEPPSNPFTPLLDGLYEYMHITDSAA